MTSFTLTDLPGCQVGRTTFETVPYLCNYPQAFIVSPGFPNFNPADIIGSKSTYLITTLPGTYVDVEFDFFDIPSSGIVRCRVGFLVARDGMSLTDDEIGTPLCNDNPPIGPLQSSRNQLHIDFGLDPLLGGGGFAARYVGRYFQPRRSVIPSSDSCNNEWYYFHQHCYRFFQSNEQVKLVDVGGSILLNFSAIWVCPESIY